MSEEKTIDEASVQWSKNGNTFSAAGMTVSCLDSGMYDIKQTREGVMFVKSELKTDELLTTEGTLEKDIINEITQFWEKAPVFKQLGFLHRRGILLYGPPGTGKTSLISLVVADMIKRGGVVVFSDSTETLTQGLKEIRDIEPTRQIVVLMEDLEETIRYQGASALLSLLDGEDTIDGCLFLGTTNFLQNLDNRIIGRPKRFDRLYKVTYPNASIRSTFFKHKLSPLNLSEADIEEYVTKTDGLSFAALADVVISTQCFGIPLAAATSTLKKYQKAANAKQKSDPDFD